LEENDSSSPCLLGVIVFSSLLDGNHSKERPEMIQKLTNKNEERVPHMMN
jgi:hypothetical protein